MAKEIQPVKEDVDIQRLQTSLRTFSERVTPHIGEHSRVATQQTLPLNDALAYAKTQGSTLYLNAEVLFMSQERDEEIAFTLNRLTTGEYVYDRYHRDPIWLITPRDPELCPDFLESPKGKQLIGQYTDTLTRDMRKDIGILSGSSNHDLTTAIMVLPNGSTYGPWVNTFGHLLVLGNKAVNLTTEERGFGFHPNHELHHLVLQRCRSTGFSKEGTTRYYYELLDRVSLFDEAAAMGYERKKFLDNCSLFLEEHGPVTPSQYEDSGRRTIIARSLLGNHVSFQNGNQEMYNQDLRTLFYRRAGFDTQQDADSPSIQLDKSFVIMDDGNTSRRLIDLTQSDRPVMSFEELMSPKFDSAKYPQIMLFSFFIEQFGDVIKNNIDTYFKYSPQNMRYRGLQFNYYNPYYSAYSSPIYTEQEREEIGQIVKDKPPLKVIDTLAENPAITLTALNANLTDQRLQANLNFPNRVTNGFLSLGQYFDSENINPLNLSTPELTEAMFKAILAQSVMETASLRTDKFRSPNQADDFARLYHCFSQHNITQLVENVWKRQAITWFKDILQRAMIVKFPDR